MKSSPRIIQEAILRTVALYDALDIALTPFEVWRFLVRPNFPSRETTRNKRRNHAKLEPPTLREIFIILTQLKQKGVLEEQWGTYVLPGRRGLCEERVRKKKIADQKWKLVRRAARWLALVPFIELVASNGSLAKCATSLTSDLDVLIVVREGRIWTARLLATLLMQLAGWRRHGTQTRDRVCLNHYIADDALIIHDELITTPHMIAWMEPILEIANSKWQVADGNRSPAISSGLFAEFIKANGWVGEYLWNWHKSKDLWAGTLHQIQSNPMHNFVRNSLERLLVGSFGERIESLARSLQLRYMERSRAQLTPEERACVKISNSALEFHPALGRFYQEFQKRFTANLAALELLR